jgi:hypothetical protein
MFICIPGFFHVTPHTADIAPGSANEIGSFSLMKPFSLNGIEGFHYWERSIRYFALHDIDKMEFKFSELLKLLVRGFEIGKTKMVKRKVHFAK